MPLANAWLCPTQPSYCGSAWKQQRLEELSGCDENDGTPSFHVKENVFGRHIVKDISSGSAIAFAAKSMNMQLIIITFGHQVWP
ncbi:uncharacterized protein N7469_006713 [Penicillium citrinum]|uniref:Uncharacterized protein n=1 Tax=Penicillium citrinum TaxID=5077 RepID=A0A9W9NUZ7_PENCI|nr:uncharacterized protein N7469_006713 [Penicillium citrinum]KAJ5226707.1 hypothetical protein N7469_006713 [Penicillium citrinum]